ncbi:MAG: host attachment protein [Candidatus Eiseniibacteriota bacterium]
MKKTRTWILIADGARARILQSEGWGTGLTPVPGQAREIANPPTRDQVSDRPGHVQESANSARHAIAPRTDWHRYEKHLFAGALADIVNRASLDKAFDRLVLVAPPHTLGDLRQALDKQARKRVAAELDKDLTHLSLDELQAQLEKIVPV